MMDLLITGKYGLLAEQKLLGTTSNNITNVNTEGYIRKNTNVYTNVVDWGVGETYTRRMYNQFVQREMLRDQGNQAYYEAYVSGMDTIDKTLSDDALSVSNRVNALFSSLSDAVDNPTSIACREELMINCENLTDDFNTLATYTMQQITDVNGKVEDQVSVINGLTYGIYDLNRQLLANASEDSEIKLQMMDKRDYLVSQLSEIVGTSYNVEDNGTYSVYMSDGNLLVNNDVYSVFERSASEFDPTRSELYVSYRTEDAHDNKTNIRLDPTKIGGKMGGYMMSTDELRQTMRELGRLAVAIADGMNQQNRAGITLEGTAGGDIFSTTSVLGVSSDANFTCTMTYNEGEGSKLLACDFKVLAYNDSGTTPPFGYKVYSLDKHGNETELD
nr:flagellar hook-associated protein FlgK [Succinivibrionaceae bacterium]